MFLSLSIKRKDKQPETEAPRPSKTHGDRPGGPKNRMTRDEFDDTPF